MTSWGPVLVQVGGEARGRRGARLGCGWDKGAEAQRDLTGACTRSGGAAGGLRAVPSPPRNTAALGTLEPWP